MSCGCNPVCQRSSKPQSRRPAAEGPSASVCPASQASKTVRRPGLCYQPLLVGNQERAEWGGGELVIITLVFPVRKVKTLRLNDFTVWTDTEQRALGATFCVNQGGAVILRSQAQHLPATQFRPGRVQSSQHLILLLPAILLPTPHPTTAHPSLISILLCPPLSPGFSHSTGQMTKHRVTRLSKVK